MGGRGGRDRGGELRPDAEPRTTYDAAWGAAHGGWLFASSAGSPEERAALATALVAAVGSS